MLRTLKFRAPIAQRWKLETLRPAAGGLLNRISFSTSTLRHKASPFEMPAMSPTMTEGGVVEWKLQAGDKFEAGDVLLEIETDKAQISVEAADDGVLAKILVENGTQEVAVGTPIAVLAEPDDDVSSIDFDSIVQSSEPKSESKESSESPKEEPKEQPAPKQDTQSKSSEPSSAKVGPVLPAALRLAQENNLDLSEIKGTGPKGRILKGDVLAALGQIAKDYPKKEADRFEKTSHLDLSNVKVAQNKPPADTKSDAPKPLVLQGTFDLGLISGNVSAAIARASRLAVREALLAEKPRPSVLRDPVFDKLTAPTPKIPFTPDLRVLSKFGRPKAVQVNVTIEPKLISRGELAGNVYLQSLKLQLEGSLGQSGQMQILTDHQEAPSA